MELCLFLSIVPRDPDDCSIDEIVKRSVVRIVGDRRAQLKRRCKGRMDNFLTNSRSEARAAQKGDLTKTVHAKNAVRRKASRTNSRWMAPKRSAMIASLRFEGFGLIF